MNTPQFLSLFSLGLLQLIVLGLAYREIQNNINRKAKEIMATLADVQAEVTAEDTVIDSAVALIQGLAAAVAALKPDQAAIDALAADIKGKSDALAAAVTANTPAK